MIHYFLPCLFNKQVLPLTKEPVQLRMMVLNQAIWGILKHPAVKCRPHQVLILKVMIQRKVFEVIILLERYLKSLVKQSTCNVRLFKLPGGRFQCVWKVTGLVYNICMI